VYHLGTDDYQLFEPGPFEMVRYDPARVEHLDAIVRVHDAEPYRIARTREHYEALFSLPKTTTYLALQGKEVLAYLTFGKAINKPGLIEAGGRLAALESLVRSVLQTQVAEQGTQAVVPLTPTVLKQLLDAKVPGARHPVEEAAGVGHQMMRINSLKKLLSSIRSHLRQQSLGVVGDVCLVCRETGEEITFRFRDGDVHLSFEASPDPVVLSRRQLVQLLFGNHPTAIPVKVRGRAGEILEAVFPYYFPIWEVDHC
jgi:hypothetical protein